MTSTNPLLAYFAIVIMSFAVACWLVGLYSIIRFGLALHQLRRTTGLRWAPYPGTTPSFPALLSWLATLPASCQVHLRRAYISGGVFVGLIVVGMVVFSVTGPAAIHR